MSDELYDAWGRHRGASADERMLTEKQLRVRFAKAVALHNGLRAWCRFHGVTVSLASAYRTKGGKCPPRIAAALGYVRVIRYRTLTEATP